MEPRPLAERDTMPGAALPPAVWATPDRTDPALRDTALDRTPDPELTPVGAPTDPGSPDRTADPSPRDTVPGATAGPVSTPGLTSLLADSGPSLAASPWLAPVGAPTEPGAALDTADPWPDPAAPTDLAPDQTANPSPDPVGAPTEPGAALDTADPWPNPAAPTKPGSARDAADPWPSPAAPADPAPDRTTSPSPDPVEATTGPGTALDRRTSSFPCPATPTRRSAPPRRSPISGGLEPARGRAPPGPGTSAAAL